MSRRTPATSVVVVIAIIAAAVAGGYWQLRRPSGGAGPTVVLLGDSLTAAVGAPGQERQDWFAVANRGARLQVLANAGVNGERSDEMLARLDTDVLDRAPQWCTVLAGTNDVWFGRTADDIIFDLSTIYDQLADRQIGIVAFTIPPLILEGSPDKVDTLRQVNDWLRAHVETDWEDAHLVDWSTELSADGDGVTPAATFFVDGIHFDKPGAQIAGSVAAPVLERLGDLTTP